MAISMFCMRARIRPFVVGAFSSQNCGQNLQCVMRLFDAAKRRYKTSKEKLLLTFLITGNQ